MGLSQATRPRGAARDDTSVATEAKTGDPSRATRAIPDAESAAALVAFVRAAAGREDGSGEWMPFALLNFERESRIEAEGTRTIALPQQVNAPADTSTSNPTLRPFLAKVREVSAARRAILHELRSALEGGDEGQAIQVARKLVGIGDASS
jgi:hypothetical protein